MQLVNPDFATVFWMLLSFGVVLFILKRFAWKPILKALKDREESIEGALESADRAKAEMEQLKTDNEAIMQEAKREREIMLREAREVKDKIIKEAKVEAGREADKMIENARINIEHEKASALHEIKEQVASLSVEIAEKILREKLKTDKHQRDLINSMLKELN
jgi:F-type H+-transporting ATPase subunit b